MQVTADGTFVLGFTNISGAPFTVLSSTDVLAPVSDWTILGQASEILPGQFQYSDTQALNRDAEHKAIQIRLRAERRAAGGKGRAMAERTDRGIRVARSIYIVSGKTCLGFRAPAIRPRNLK